MAYKEHRTYTWDLLHEMQDEAYKDACRSDLYFWRKSIKLFDGWILIASGDLARTTYSLFLPKEIFATLKQGEIDYLINYYGLE